MEKSLTNQCVELPSSERSPETNGTHLTMSATQRYPTANKRRRMSNTMKDDARTQSKDGVLSWNDSSVASNFSGNHKNTGMDHYDDVDVLQNQGVGEMSKSMDWKHEIDPCNEKARDSTSSSVVINPSGTGGKQPKALFADRQSFTSSKNDFAAKNGKHSPSLSITTQIPNDIDTCVLSVSEIRHDAPKDWYHNEAMYTEKVCPGSELRHGNLNSPDEANIRNESQMLHSPASRPYQERLRTPGSGGMGASPQRISHKYNKRSYPSQNHFGDDDLHSPCENPGSRIGPNFQVTELPIPSNNFKKSEQGVVIWSPQLARLATLSGQDLDGFLEKAKESNVSFQLMEALHRSGYNTKAALTEFIGMYHENPDMSIEITNGDQRRELESIFERLAANAHGEGNGMDSTARALKTRREKVIVHYYRWKCKSSVYQKRKSLLRRQPLEYDTCFVCQDGGLLLICDRCNKTYHPRCVNLRVVPEKEWLCENCKSEHIPRKKGRPTPTSGKEMLPTLLSVHKELGTAHNTKGIVTSSQTSFPLNGVADVSHLCPPPATIHIDSRSESTACFVSAFEGCVGCESERSVELEDDQGTVESPSNSGSSISEKSPSSASCPDVYGSNQSVTINSPGATLLRELLSDRSTLSSTSSDTSFMKSDTDFDDALEELSSECDSIPMALRSPSQPDGGLPGFRAPANGTNQDSTADKSNSEALTSLQFASTCGQGISSTSSQNGAPYDTFGYIPPFRPPNYWTPAYVQQGLSSKVQYQPAATFAINPSPLPPSYCSNIAQTSHTTDSLRAFPPHLNPFQPGYAYFNQYQTAKPSVPIPNAMKYMQYLSAHNSSDPQP